jgi:hypothetical protein
MMNYLQFLFDYLFWVEGELIYGNGLVGRKGKKIQLEFKKGHSMEWRFHRYSWFR